MLESDDHELRRLAAVFLGLVEQIDNGRDLARLLRGEDPLAVALCERALWEIWLRAAGPDAAETLREVTDLWECGRTANAFKLLDDLITRHPTFAEAYHQRGLAYSLREDHHRAIEDFRRAVRLNSVHFTAMANLGHCCVQLGRFQAAREWYLAALRVHPRMPGVRQMLRRLGELGRANAPLRH